MDGYTDQDGRVEVCVEGQWGTVFFNNQDGIAGAVCSQLGFAVTGNTITCCQKLCSTVTCKLFV